MSPLTPDAGSGTLNRGGKTYLFFPPCSKDTHRSAPVVIFLLLTFFDVFSHTTRYIAPHESCERATLYLSLVFTAACARDHERTRSVDADIDVAIL